ncbi:MAG: ABC transporter permease [Bacteroidota bacterium]
MKVINDLGEFGFLVWQVVRRLGTTWHQRKRLVAQMEHMGVHSLPLVLIVGIFSGAIIAWQAAYQFRGMVSLNVMGGQVARVVFMEMAPVLTALVISGRIGASMTAELGTMKISQQLDALRCMGIDPISFLVIPRVVALILMMPVLTFFALVISLLGAYAVSDYFLDITRQQFFQSIQDFFQLSDLTGGLIKSMVFGATIAFTGCFVGITATGGAAGVGKATIRSFVLSAISILAGDFLLWIILF